MLSTTDSLISPLLIIITSGSAFVKTGPAGVLIDYSIIGICVFMVMAALGEMVSYAPSARMFSTVGEKEQS